jgi:hypothetical protein
MPLTEMSRRLEVPVSTVFDCMQEVEKFFRFTIVLRDSEKDTLVRNTPANFEFAYDTSVKVEKEKEVPLSAYTEHLPTNQANPI